MYRIATYARKGQVPAISAFAFLLLLSFFVPPFIWAGSAVLFYLSFYIKITHLLKVVLLSATAVSLLFYLIDINPFVAMSITLVWVLLLPFLFIYKKYGFSLTFELLSFFALLVCFIILSNFDSVAIWQNYFSELLSNATKNELQAQKLEQALTKIYPILTGIIVSVFLFGYIVSIIFARFWQNKDLKKNDFWSDFLQIKFSKLSTILAIVLTILSVLFSDVIFLQNFLYIFVALFMFQGLAIGHYFSQHKNLSPVWITGFYIALFLFFYPLVLLVSLVGVADYWGNFRRLK
jgi:hypothetical protein